ncbi:MAG: hypothetical protein V4510_07750 [bacterium]
MGAPEVQAETALLGFLQGLDPPVALPVRTIAHAWQGGGGNLAVGRLAIRLVAVDAQGRPFTAGTLHAGASPRLELARVLLHAHGVSAASWTAWCDERPELPDAGFDPQAKFPRVELSSLADTALARLALGARDLARSVTLPS